MGIKGLCRNGCGATIEVGQSHICPLKEEPRFKVKIGALPQDTHVYYGDVELDVSGLRISVYPGEMPLLELEVTQIECLVGEEETIEFEKNNVKIKLVTINNENEKKEQII